MPECPECGGKFEDSINVHCLACGYKYSKSFIELINEVEEIKKAIDVLMTLFKKGVVTLTGNINSLKKKVKKIKALEEWKKEAIGWMDRVMNTIDGLESKINSLKEKVKDLEGKKSWAMLVEEIDLTKRVIALEGKVKKLEAK